MTAEKSRRSRLRKALISMIIVSAAGVAVFMISRIPAPVEEPLPRPEELVNVEVLTVQPLAELPDILELPGAIEPYQIVNVPVEQQGKIDSIFVKEGQHLSEGEAILELDSTLLRAEYDRAKAQADFDDRTYERSIELLERGVLNKNEVEEVSARRTVSQADLSVASTNLERAIVKSPLGGILNELTKERGEYVSAGDTIAQIVDIDKVKVVIQIPERDVRYIRLGSVITVCVDALDGREVRGRVSYVSEVADEATRTTRVEVTVDNQGQSLRAGMIVRATIPRRVLRDVVMIPLSSVIPLEEGRVVYVVRDGLAERHEVALGMIRGTQVQVLNGLSLGDQIIVKGQRLVGPGQKVRIMQSN